MSKQVFYEKDEKSGQVRGVCRLPVEVMYFPPNPAAKFECNKKASLRVWRGQGDGKDINRQDLLDYAAAARKWADILEKIAREAVL